MAILVWKEDVPKAMTEEERIRAGLHDSGGGCPSYVKNIPEEYMYKWIAKYLPKAERIEIQKRIHGADLKIIVGTINNHPKLSQWDKETLYKRGLVQNQFVISVGQNGTSMWTLQDIKEFLQAIHEAITVITTGNKDV